MTMQRHVLPVSGQVLEQRPDGRWRLISAAQAAAESSGAFSSGHADWEGPDAPEAVRGRAQHSRHPSNPPRSWWLLVGRGGATAVQAATADGVRRVVTQYGPLWVCEWTGPTQAVEVLAGGLTTTMFHRRAHDRA